MPAVTAREQRARWWVGILLVSALLVAGVGHGSAGAQAVFTVDSAGDDVDASKGDGICATVTGACTLRAAIEEANALAGSDEIHFDLPGPPYRIQPSSTYLPIVTDPVVIDGTTQPGYAGTPVVEIDGSLLSGAFSGLQLVTSGSTIRGLAVTGFGGNGIFLRSGGGSLVEGNFIGVDVTGAAAVGNGGGGVVVSSPGNTIGGAAPGAGNVISGNQGDGIHIISAGNVVEGNFIGTDVGGTFAIPNGANGIEISSPDAIDNRVGGTVAGAGNLVSGNAFTGVQVINGAAGTLVFGNLIGTDATGSAPVGNGQGVLVKDASANVGGTAPGAGNVISGNAGSGITVSVADLDALAFVQGNLVGTDASGAGPLGNGVDGIYVAADTHFVRIGDISDPAAGNVIAYNGGRGVRVESPSQVQIMSNSVFANGELGIDRAPLGVSASPPSDIAVGWLDMPVLEGAESDATTTVIGSRTGPPGFEAAIQFFANDGCDPSGYGEGARFLGQVFLSDLGDGVETFTAVLPVATPAGQVITAAAVAEDGSTSEFSACEDVVTVPPGLSPQVKALKVPKKVNVSDLRPVARVLRVRGQLDGLPSGELVTATMHLYRNGTLFVTREVPVTGGGGATGRFTVEVPYSFTPADAPMVTWGAEVIVGARTSGVVIAVTEVRVR